MESVLFAELLESAQEAVKISKGLRKPSRVFTYELPDVAKARKNLGMTQTEFAALLGVSERTVASWEQGRRVPSGAAMMLLRVATRRPAAILDTVRGR